MYRHRLRLKGPLPTVDWMSDQAFVGWVKGLITGGSGGGIASGRVVKVLAAGANNNLNPGGGWPTGIGRLILTSGGSTANVTGLVAGIDNQWVLIQNDDATATITLNNENAGSTAANQFSYVADLALPPEATVIAIYDATEGFWILR
jgi:hypothetical protein